jgi:UDP-GlcNAc3NAcA epimerase
MRIITVIGARPQFVKAAVVSRAIRQKALLGADIQESILHTGQHYDYNMSDLFFSQLDIPAPEWHLDCGNDTVKMKAAILPILRAGKPDIVLVYGDTYSTLAGAEAAHELAIPVAHIEAGLRSFNDAMPEEYNRIATDRIASWLFCPTTTAVENLRREGISRGVYHTGDVMYDAALAFTPDEAAQRQIILSYGLEPKTFALTTVHRASTAENTEALTSIIAALAQVGMPVLWPVHPHTRKTIERTRSLQQALRKAPMIQLIEPVGYTAMLALERQARLIITDSGGIQKEAFFQHTPCVTLRDESEWVETLKAGWNRLAGTDTERILQAVRMPFEPQPIDEYGSGHSAEQIIDILCHIKS